MKEQGLAVVILAAGLGKRMQSDLPKVAVSTRQLPMISHVINTASVLNPEKLVVITGHKKEVVENIALGAAKNNGLSVEFAFQEIQKGTGHAVSCAESLLDNWQGTILILCGDVPLIKSQTLTKLLEAHHSSNATLSLVSSVSENPGGLGRIVRDDKNQFLKIVEAKDSSEEELLIKEINAGIYAVDSSFLWSALKRINNTNQQGEYYLTDIAEMARTEGQSVSIYRTDNFIETIGVNSKVELNTVNQILREEEINLFKENGVSFKDQGSFYHDYGISIGQGTVVGPNVHIYGQSKVGNNVVIEGSAYLIDTEVSDDCVLKFSIRSEGARIGSGSSVGPFANLRPKSCIGKASKIGNFVETKASTIGDRTAVSHLSYLGDCIVEDDCNIGAGTITCNYDGANKHKTLIKTGTFVGSNSCLVAPVTIEENTTIGAGSVITKNTEPNSLVLTRPELKVKSGYKRPTKK